MGARQEVALRRAANAGESLILTTGPIAMPHLSEAVST
jgi:hypothetical protein